MKILLLTQFYPPILGGEERHVYNLARLLAGRGHEVSVLTLAAGRDPGRTVDDGVTVHAVRSAAMHLPLYSDPTRPHATPLADPLIAREIGRVVREERPDVIHAHNWIVNSALGHRTIGDTPLVLTLHDYSHVCATKRSMRDGKRCAAATLATCVKCASCHYGAKLGVPTSLAVAAMKSRRARRVGHFIAVSRAVAERNGLPVGGSPWSVIPNFVPASALSPILPVSGPASGLDGAILFVGDLSRDKGLDVLLKAYAGLGPNRPNLVAVGRRCADTPTESVDGAELFDGWPHDRVLDAFQRCAFAVAPSLCPDACPTTVLEAMAAGRAVITTRTGGMPDMVVHEESGLLVEVGSVSGLQAALRRLVDEPDRAARLGRAARQQVAAFTDGAVAARIEDVYRSVAASASRSGAQHR